MDSDLVVDLKRLREQYGIEVLVSLVEDSEFDELCIPDLVGKAKQFGIHTLRFPIRDLGVPKNLEAFSLMVDQIVDELREEKKIAIIVDILCNLFPVQFTISSTQNTVMSCPYSSASMCGRKKLSGSHSGKTYLAKRWIDWRSATHTRTLWERWSSSRF